ncbi:MAG: hypothetical protein ACFCVF_13935 [Kineosporiaceae bacterium]
MAPWARRVPRRAVLAAIGGSAAVAAAVALAFVLPRPDTLVPVPSPTPTDTSAPSSSPSEEPPVAALGEATSTVVPSVPAEPSEPSAPGSASDPTPADDDAEAAPDEPAPGAGPGAAGGPPPLSGYPDSATTGFPDGTALAPYGGSCDVTRDTVIERALVRCRIVVTNGADLVIRASRVEGVVDIEDRTASVLIEDSEIDAGTQQTAAVGYVNVTVRRSEIRGGQHGVNCVANCRVEGSYLHSQFVSAGSGAHLQPFLSNGAQDVVLVGNTMSCTVNSNAAGGGCTANVSIFGDFSGNSNFLIERNYFVASQANGYCVYGGTDPGKPYGRDVSGIRYLANVFERGGNGTCGYWGPVTSFDRSAPGNVWSGNVWDDGTPVTL